MAGRSCAASSIGVVAGAQKQFYVSKGGQGGLPALVRAALGLKARLLMLQHLIDHASKC